MFPLGRSWAGEQKLPLPLGIGVTYYYQQQDYGLVSLDVGPIPIPPDLLSDVQVTNHIHEINLKADLWVLPFLNVFGIIGDVSGETKVDLGQLLGQLTVDYDGLVYGGGFTAAVGVKRFFTSLTTHFMATDLKGDRSSVSVLLLTPKAGIVFDRGALWGGAMYQRADEEHIGSIFIPPFGDVDYEVVLKEKTPWNFLVGGQFEVANALGPRSRGEGSASENTLLSRLLIEGSVGVGKQEETGSFPQFPNALGPHCVHEIRSLVRQRSI